MGVPPSDAYGRLVRRGRRLAALGGGLASAASFGAIYGLFGMILDSPFNWVLPVAACLVSAVAAPLLWGLLAPGGGRFRIGLGTLSGVLTALLAHIGLGIAAYAVFLLDPSLVSRSASPAQTPIAYDAAMAGGTVVLSLAIGWSITLPLGALYALLVTLHCRARARR
ncbi:MAG: hypothetical protein KDA49_12050 [Rhodospirillaceae bacterium]|nr:hypothetical protein [Rhodospirillaceae bacterium]MCA8933196.1 hypothetical protein [Rhodospirillaceae bacterium]